MLLAPVTHIIPLAKIRRRRVLPVPGSVLVRGGQQVAADEVIAQASVSPEHISRDIARGLGVPPERASEYLKRRVGEQLTADSIIAKKGGRSVMANRDGIFVAFSNGQALIEVRDQPFELQAGLPGTVMDVEADYGATIETIGAWVQCVWGNGPVKDGPLKVLVDGPEEELGTDVIDPTLRGSVFLAGQCSEGRALERVAEVSPSGLILGSMTTRLLPVASKMPYPIVVVDGFGKIPMNMRAFTLLSTNADRLVAVNAEPYNRFTGTRPEVIIPLSGVGQPPIPMDLETFAIGQNVRVVKEPHASKIGKITYLSEKLTTFSSGLRALAATVQLENGENVTVPLANIEVLG